MKLLITWLIIFIIIYLFYLLFVILRKKKIKQFDNSVYVLYLIKVYKLNKKNIKIKSLAHIIALANAFIIATSFIIVCSVKDLILMIFTSIFIVIPLILLVYHIIGKILQRRDKNE